MKNFKEELLTILLFGIILATFGFVYYCKNKVKEEVPVTHILEVKESKPHLTNPNKALELVIKHLKEEHNIIVPIEDVDKLEISTGTRE
jgi:hypothetical protein